MIGLVERAFVLAQSGMYGTIEDLRKVLKAEKHEAVDSHLSSPSLTKQLRRLLRISQTKS